MSLSNHEFLLEWSSGGGGFGRGDPSYRWHSNIVRLTKVQTHPPLTSPSVRCCHQTTTNKYYNSASTLLSTDPSVVGLLDHMYYQPGMLINRILSVVSQLSLSSIFFFLLIFSSRILSFIVLWQIWVLRWWDEVRCGNVLWESETGDTRGGYTGVDFSQSQAVRVSGPGMLLSAL